MKAVSLGHGSYLLNNGTRSLILDSQRNNAEYGYDKAEKRSLSKEEIESLLEDADSKEVEELTQEEIEQILKDVILVHPEIKYIVSAGGLKDAFKNLGKGLQNAFDTVFVGLKDKREKKAALQKWLHDNKDKMESTDKKIKENEPLIQYLEESLKKGEMTDKDIVVMNELLKNNPEMAKEFTINKESKRKQSVREKLTGLEKKFKGNEILMTFLEDGLDFRQFEEKEMAILISMLKKDPNWVKTIDPVKNYKNITKTAKSYMLFDLNKIPLKDYTLPKAEALKSVEDYLESKGYSLQNIKMSLSDDAEAEGKRVIGFHAPRYGILTKCIKALNLTATDVHKIAYTK